MHRDLASLLSPEWLTACPTGILAARGPDALWASPALERMARLPLGSLCPPRGPGHPLLARLMEADGLTALDTGQDTRVWLFCEQARVAAPDGGELTLRYFQDVSGEVQAAAERDTLAHQVRELNLTDPLTGLANRRALAQALNAQVSRSRRYHNRLSLAVVRVATPSPQGLPDAAVLAVSRFLRERLRWVDEIGRHAPDAFMLILPETGLEAAEGLLGQIRREADGLTPPPPHQDLPLRLLVGVAEWRKGMDAGRLVGAAEAGLDAPAAAGAVRG